MLCVCLHFIGEGEQIVRSETLICDLACRVWPGECGCGLGTQSLGVCEMGSRRREVYRQIWWNVLQLIPL